MASRRHRASSASSAARRFEIPHSRWCSTRHVSSFLTEAIVVLLADLHAPSQTRVRDLYAPHLTIPVSVLAAAPSAHAAMIEFGHVEIEPDRCAMGADYQWPLRSCCIRRCRSASQSARYLR